MGAVLSSLPGADSQLNPRVTRDIEKQVDNLVRLRKLYPAKIGTAEITAIEKCIQVVIPEIHRRWFWREWLEYTNLLTLLVIVVGSGWLAWRFLWPPSVWTPILLVLMGVVIVVLAQAMFALIIKAERIFIRWRTGPIETVLVLLFDSAAILVDGIDEDKSRRRAVNELTEAALAAEWCFADLGRGMDSTLRRWAEGIGFEVSATIRVHQQLLLDPGHGKHVAALHSLVNGITQLSVGNYDPFLRGLPERRSRRPLWQKMLYRLSIPAILIGSALYLPSLFPGAIPADSLSTFRATLITAGVFAFLSPNLDEARSILLDALKK